jgi:hypothetical protein
VEVSFHRGEGRAYFALARRDDGVLVRLQGFAYDRSFDPPLPHDLAHFVVEEELKLKAGLWGVIAAGGLFGPNMVVAGRQRPHARERGREVKKWAGDRLGQAEVLVRVLCEIARAGEEFDLAVLDRIPERRRPEDLNAGDVQRTCSRLRDAARQWAGVPQGGSLDFVWGSSVDTSLADRPRRARRKQWSRLRSTR